MSIFNTAYDTTVGRGFVMNKVELAIKESFIKDNLYLSRGDVTISLEIRPVFIYGEGASEANIPYFSHPLFVRDIQKNKYLCIDVRSFVKQGQFDISNHFSIKNQTEFNLAKARLILNLLWLTQRPEIQRDMSIVPNAVFSSWISEGLSRRFALDPKDQLSLAVIASFYYQTLFNKFSTFDDEERHKMVSQIIKATRAPARIVFEITDKITEMKDISSFCKTCQEVLENPRLEDLNAPLLITILGSSWFGMSAKEILAVSLEHPPTWISLVYTAMTERTFKNSMIAKIAERYSGNKGGGDFIRSFVSLIETTIDSESQDTF